MLNIIFNIIGILFIGYGIFILKSNNKSKNSSVNFYDEGINHFKELLDEKIDMETSRENNSQVSGEKLENSIYKANIIRKNTDIEEVKKDKSSGQTEDIKYEHKSLIIDSKSKNLVLDKPKNFKDEILSLHKLGIDKEEIAKKTGKSVREIDVILKINKVG